MELDITKLLWEWILISHRWLYKWAAKPDLKAAGEDVKESDCSGCTRWLVYQACGQVLPEGSVDQHDFCVKNGFHKLEKYTDLAYAKTDGTRVFMAFEAPTSEHSGHVWLVYKGKTMECRGHHGTEGRAWNDGVLLDIATSCFELPTKKDAGTPPPSQQLDQFTHTENGETF